jgi:hypothetical protein
MSFLSGLFSKNRRRARRHESPRLVGYLWTGGNSGPNQVRDVSKTGLFLVTNDRWYPGTLVRLVVQTSDAAEGRNEDKEAADRSISVQSKVVRHTEDGLGLEFYPIENSSQNKNAPKEGAGLKELDKFLRTHLVDKVDKK